MVRFLGRVQDYVDLDVVPEDRRVDRQVHLLHVDLEGDVLHRRTAATPVTK